MYFDIIVSLLVLVIFIFTVIVYLNGLKVDNKITSLVIKEFDNREFYENFDLDEDIKVLFENKDYQFLVKELYKNKRITFSYDELIKKVKKTKFKNITVCEKEFNDLIESLLNKKDYLPLNTFCEKINYELFKLENFSFYALTNPSLNDYLYQTYKKEFINRVYNLSFFISSIDEDEFKYSNIRLLYEKRMKRRISKSFFENFKLKKIKTVR